MALPSDITLDTAEYALITQRPTSSVRRNKGSSITSPMDLHISHETLRDGRVSSVVYIDSQEVIPCNSACDIAPVVDNIRVMFKVQYSPISGRADTAVIMEALKSEIQAFLDSADYYPRFLNQET